MASHTTRLFAAAASTVFLTGSSAAAADLASAESVANWGGFYGGVHAGGGFSDGNSSFAEQRDLGPYILTPTGGLAGLQVGYNWQFGRMVYGVELDGSWANLDEDQDLGSPGFPLIAGFETDALASARIRSGIATGNALFYGTFGLGYADTTYKVSGDGASAERDFSEIGLAAGFGLEWALGPNWSLRGEYVYYRFDESEDTTTLLPGTSDSTTDFARFDRIHTFKLGLNYRLGDGAGDQVAVEAPAADWAGFYAGAHGGYGWSRMFGTHDESGDQGSFDFDPEGGLGGVQVGYNWQNGAWVYGIEADGSWAGMENDRTDDDGDLQELETDVLASLRARVGITSGRSLFYVTGGLGYARSTLDVTEGGIKASRELDSFGAVIGSGTEFSLTPNLSVRVEGLTYFLDEEENLAGFTADSENNDFVQQGTVSVIRAGINYRF